MNPALALHTAARRYCLERHTFWCDRYSEIVRRGADRERDGYHYTREALATFPRYNVLNAIRVELERIDPRKLGSLEETRALAISAGESADDDFTRSPIDSIEQHAMAEEREEFVRFVRELSPTDLIAAEALPFRRVLTGAESKELWSRLGEHWQIGDHHYWYPLVESAGADVVAFWAEAFEKDMPAKRLQGLLSARGIERVIELREFGPEYEESVSLATFRYNLAEGFWFSGDLDWIVYASHESSVTIGGWLLEELQTVWPTCREHVWTGWSTA